MKNKYYDYGDGIIAIEASGMGKYGLHIVVDAHRLAMINQQAGCWTIIKEEDMYYAAIVDGPNIIFMHDLIVSPQSSLIEEKFIRPTLSDTLVTNPFSKGKVGHLNHDGLCNLDANLILTDGYYSFTRAIPDYQMYKTPIIERLDDELTGKYSLLELLNSDDPNKDHFIQEYIAFLDSVKEDSLVRRLHLFDGYFTLTEKYKKGSLDTETLKTYPSGYNDLYEDVESARYHYTSHYLFDGHTIILYPKITYHIALKYHICAFSGNRIRPGEEYTRYHLFMEDLTTGDCYALKHPIICEMGNEDKLPMTIDALDDFEYRLYNGHDTGDVNYYDVAANIGNNGLSYVKLKRR